MKRILTALALLSALVVPGLALAGGFTNATSATNATDIYFCASGCTGVSELNGHNGTLSPLDTMFSIQVTTNGTLTSGDIAVYGDNGCGSLQALSGTIDATNPAPIELDSTGWTRLKFVPSNFSGNIGFTVHIRSR